MRSPQTNGICELFHKPLLDEFYRVTFRKKIYDTPDALQAELEEWMAVYNVHRHTKVAGVSANSRWILSSTAMFARDYAERRHGT